MRPEKERILKQFRHVLLTCSLKVLSVLISYGNC